MAGNVRPLRKKSGEKKDKQKINNGCSRCMHAHALTPTTTLAIIIITSFFSTLWIMIIIMHCMHGEKVVNGDIKCEAN